MPLLQLKPEQQKLTFEQEAPEGKQQVPFRHVAKGLQHLTEAEQDDVVLAHGEGVGIGVGVGVGYTQ